MKTLERRDIMRIRNIKNAQEIIDGSKYIVKDPKNYQGKWSLLFNNPNPIDLEIGMGKGDFIIDMALKNPHINFIGIEKYTSIIARACEKLTNYNLPNLKLINGNALNLEQYFNKEINTIYLNFSDPWPKKRHSNRRLTATPFLKIYDNIFQNTKTIIQKTDNLILFQSSIVSLSTYGYTIIDCNLDLANSEIITSETEYERKFKKEGIKINYLKACKKQ